MIKGIRRGIRNFFGFSHGEAKGFLLLIWLLLALSLGYLVYRSMPGEGYTSYKEDKALLDSLVSVMERRELETSPIFTESPTREERIVPQLFQFDPNQLPADSLRLLGLPGWLASRIEKYRQKGGRFREKEDLLKIYGLSDTLYARLEPYIQIPSFPGREKAAYSNPAYTERPPEERRPTALWKEKKPPVRMDINQADSLELQAVRGIGPVLSGRIVRFREMLGGFVTMNQLYEVWGLDSAVVEEVKAHAFIEQEYQPAMIKINSATREELATHPYISPSQARLLHAYRQQHGPFKSTDELLKIHTLNSEFVKKVAPYILLD